MTEREADQVLDQVELIPVVQGALADIKRLKAECLAADIPVMVISPPGKT